MTLVDSTYDKDLNDLSSQKSRNLTVQITAILVPFFTRKFPTFIGIVIIRFFRGSVGVDFQVLLEPSSNVTNTAIVQELQNANGTKELEFVVLGRISATEVTPTTAPPTPTGVLLMYFNQRSVLGLTSRVSCNFA